jgi:hypothetical protein
MRTTTPVALACALAFMAAAARADIPAAAIQGEILQRFVDDAGLVDYAGLKSDTAPLEHVVQDIATQDAAAYESWSEPEKLAFWLNSYNFLTLKLIVDHYPIQPAPGREKYPAQSIQQIPNAWSRKRFTVMGTERSLDEIEHEIIRARFKEPRVHWALVCAAMSCPPLRREPYRGDALDRQLDDQARRVFSDLRFLHLDREAGEVWVSRILDWFSLDFVPGADREHEQLVVERMAVRAAAAPYVGAQVKQYLESAQYTVRFFEYDWTLNEQAK